MKKLVLTIILSSMIAVIPIILAGCVNINGNSSLNAYTLTDRQKEILQNEGLSNEWENLSFKEKIAIEAIEEMLQYLENEYPNDIFQYQGYVSDGFDDQEHLIAQCNYGEVTVFRNDDGSFNDNYVETKLSYLISDMINLEFSKIVDENDFIVTADVNKCDKNIKNYRSKDILSNCTVAITIFVKESVGQEKFADSAKQFCKFIDKNKNITNSNISIDFYLVENDQFAIDLPYNYKNSINTNIFLDQISWYKNSNGEEKFDVQ